MIQTFPTKLLFVSISPKHVDPSMDHSEIPVLGPGQVAPGSADQFHTMTQLHIDFGQSGKTSVMVAEAEVAERSRLAYTVAADQHQAAVGRPRAGIHLRRALVASSRSTAADDSVVVKI